MSLPGRRQGEFQRTQPEGPRVSQDILRCAQCDAPLPFPTAICAACEAQDATRPALGGHVCPTCAGRFHRPHLVHLPKDAPWWRARSTRMACPHCAQVLLDRAREPLSPWPLLALLATAAAGVRILPSGSGQHFFVIAVSAAYALAWAWVTRKIRRAPDRYAPRPPEADIAWTGAWMAGRLRAAWRRL